MSNKSKNLNFINSNKEYIFRKDFIDSIKEYIKNNNLTQTSFGRSVGLVITDRFNGYQQCTIMFKWVKYQRKMSLSNANIILQNFPEMSIKVKKRKTGQYLLFNDFKKIFLFIKKIIKERYEIYDEFYRSNETLQKYIPSIKTYRTYLYIERCVRSGSFEVLELFLDELGFSVSTFIRKEKRD